MPVAVLTRRGHVVSSSCQIGPHLIGAIPIWFRIGADIAMAFGGEAALRLVGNSLLAWNLTGGDVGQVVPFFVPIREWR